MDLPPDFKDLLAEFASAKVEFVIVGGYAVAFHARPRATKDLDIVLLGSADNLSRAVHALERFGAPPVVLKGIGGMSPDEIVYLGQPPLRVDFLRRIDGVDTEALFANAISTRWDGVDVRLISRADLIANKRAVGRPQDRIDAALLERVPAGF